PSDEPTDGRGGCGRRPARRRARMGVGAGGGARRVVIEPFVRHTGAVAALPRADVDTDQIIPKQFLKRVERTGFGPALFSDWRFRPDGSLNPEFELNQPEAEGATILLTGANFGCGSSRPRSRSRRTARRCCSTDSTRSDGRCSRRSGSRHSNAERGTWNAELKGGYLFRVPTSAFRVWGRGREELRDRRAPRGWDRPGG